MKAKSRKIWSLPLALAVVLMLVGVVSISAVVMAQSTGSRTLTTLIPEGSLVYEHDKSFERVYGSAGIVAADTEIVTVGIGGTAPAQVGPTAISAVIGLEVVGDTTPNGISGYQVDSSLFEINNGGLVTVRNVMIPDTSLNAAPGAMVEDTDATARNIDTINDPDGANTFTFTVNVFVDTNTGVGGDSNLATPPANGIDPEVAARNARRGFVAPGNLGDIADDLDEVNTLTVTVRVLKAKALTEFAAIPGSASANDLLYGPEGQSRGVSVTGIRSGLNVVPAIAAAKVSAVTDVDADTTISGATAFYGAADAAECCLAEVCRENYAG